MDRVKNKINIFFTTSYVIILGLAVPTVVNASHTPHCVTTNHSEAGTTSKRAAKTGVTVKVVTIDVNAPKKNNQGSNCALGTGGYLKLSEQQLAGQSKQQSQNRHDKAERLQLLAKVKLLN